MLLTCIHAPSQACSAAIGESKKHLQKVMQGLSEIFQAVEVPFCLIFLLRGPMVQNASV